jgi:hypothetical protein
MEQTNGIPRTAITCSSTTLVRVTKVCNIVDYIGRVCSLKIYSSLGTIALAVAARNGDARVAIVRGRCTTTILVALHIGRPNVWKDERTVTNPYQPIWTCQRREGICNIVTTLVPISTLDRRGNNFFQPRTTRWCVELVAK